MRVFLTIALLFALSPSWAQWDVPVRVELTSPVPEERQVSGLATPEVSDAAMSVDAARNNTTNYANATGADVLVVTLVPPPPTYTAGMVVHIVPQVANTAMAQIDINGLGTRPILKQGDVAVDAGDLVAGSPARLIYNGSAFVLLSTTYLPCPAGFRSMAREFCIEETSRTEADFFSATTACAAIGARLCSFAEWGHACRNTPGFMGTVSNYEWVDHAANNNIEAKVVGFGVDGDDNVTTFFACTNGGSQLPTTTARFRCCANR